MMPLAPTLRMAMPTSKPKIGFSIDSIVGSTAKSNQFSSGSECSERPNSSLSDCSYPTASSEWNTRIRNQMPPSTHTNAFGTRKLSSPKEHRIRRYSNSSGCANDITRNHHPSSPEPTASPSDVRCLSPDHRMSPDEKCLSQQSRSPSPGLMNGCGSVVRPFPMAHNDLKAVPAYMTAGSLPPDISSHHNSHFLAAQFQMAAALVQGQAAAAASGGQRLPPGAVFSPHHPHYINPNIQRDSYPLYPWLLSRHGRIFPSRFPGSK